MSFDSLPWAAKRGVVLVDADFVCQICGDEPATEVDHIWPRAVGGSDERSNLQAACRSCNASKGDKANRVLFCVEDYETVIARHLNRVHDNLDVAVRLADECAERYGIRFAVPSIDSNPAEKAS